MLDAFFIITPFSLLWYHSWNEVPVSGMPVLFGIFSFASYFLFLPSSVYVYGFPNFYEILLMIIVTDFTQFLTHVGIHKKIFGKKVYDSHNLHHVEKNPKPKDAFFTGFLDSIIQLIIPLYITIYLVKPNRCTVIIFGLLYSQWLLYIHSNLNYISKYMVSPEYHRKHHQKPNTNFSHVFPLWDYLLDFIV